MGNFFPAIPDFLIPWLKEQQIFWVATAPLDPSGHVNLSSKGIEGTFHIIDDNKVWYEDLTGSGVETIAHLRENGRITVFFNAFEGPAKICRLFGRGTVHEFGTPEYDALLPPEKRKPGSRAVIMIDVDKVGTSCGYSVPYFEFKAHRSALLHYAAKFEHPSTEDSPPNLVDGHWRKNNAQSIDGLPGMRDALHARMSGVYEPIEESEPKGNNVADGNGILLAFREWRSLSLFSMGVALGVGLARLST